MNFLQSTRYLCIKIEEWVEFSRVEYRSTAIPKDKTSIKILKDFIGNKGKRTVLLHNIYPSLQQCLLAGIFRDEAETQGNTGMELWIPSTEPVGKDGNL